MVCRCLVQIMCIVSKYVALGEMRGAEAHHVKSCLDVTMDLDLDGNMTTITGDNNAHFTSLPMSSDHNAATASSAAT